MLTVLPIVLTAPASALSGTLLPQVHVLVDDRGHEVVGLVLPGAGEADGAGVEAAGVAVVLHGHLLGPAPHIPRQDGLVWTLHRSDGQYIDMYHSWSFKGTSTKFEDP